MVRRLSVLVALLMLVVVLPAAPAVGERPLEVEFDVTTYFAEPVPFGTFTASGDAVLAGLMCKGGDKQELFPEKFVGNSEKVTNFQAFTEFTCREGFGAGDTFVVKIQGHFDFETGLITTNWVVKSGTGVFTDLHASGHGTGGLIFAPEGFPIGAADLFTGKLH